MAPSGWPLEFHDPGERVGSAKARRESFGAAARLLEGEAAKGSEPKHSSEVGAPWVPGGLHVEVPSIHPISIRREIGRAVLRKGVRQQMALWEEN